jgi:hypothetical protein
MTTTIKKGTYNMFINPKIECQLENGPLLRGTGQVVIWQKEDNTWDYECELADIQEIVLMGVTIIGYKEQKATIEHFKSMGINLYDVMRKAFKEIVVMSGDVKTFVFEQTGLKIK